MGGGGGGAEGTGVYAPVWFDRNTPEFAFDLTETFFLTWKTEETEAKVRKFEEAKADVIAAWKRGKARELAETAAKELKKKITDKAIKDLATLRDFAAENKVTPIELDPLAKVKMHPGFAPGMPAMYLPGNIPAENVEFADDEMIKSLLDLRDKPKGET